MENHKSDRRGHERLQTKNGVKAFYQGRSGKILDISMGGLAFCCANGGPKKPAQAAGDPCLTLSGSIRLENLPVRPVSETVLPAALDASGKKLMRYSFQFNGLSIKEAMLLGHFIRIHTLEPA